MIAIDAAVNHRILRISRLMTFISVFICEPCLPLFAAGLACSEPVAFICHTSSPLRLQVRIRTLAIYSAKTKREVYFNGRKRSLRRKIRYGARNRKRGTALLARSRSRYSMNRSFHVTNVWIFTTY